MTTIENAVEALVSPASVIEGSKIEPTLEASGLQSYDETIADLTKMAGQSSLEDDKPYKLINSKTEISQFLDTIAGLQISSPALYVDIEGVRLGRKGTISIIQILTLPRNYVYLIDVHTLGAATFSTPGANGETIKTIFESATIPKVFFDVRNDSDALFSNYGIRLAGIQDLQVMEFATRRVRSRFLNGLSKCIEKDLTLSFAETQAWKDTKQKGLNLFAPERGGSYDVFNTRPLSNEIAMYCAQDVQYMPRLWVSYTAKLVKASADRAKRATEERVRLSQGQSYNGQGKHMAVGPW